MKKIKSIFKIGAAVFAFVFVCFIGAAIWGALFGHKKEAASEKLQRQINAQDAARAEKQVADQKEADGKIAATKAEREHLLAEIAQKRTDEKTKANSEAAKTQQAEKEKSDKKAWADKLERRAFLESVFVVKKMLKAPATAIFPTYGDGCGASKGWGEQVACWGYVDAQNSFGALLRSKWFSAVEFKDGEMKSLFFKLDNESTGSLEAYNRIVYESNTTPEEDAKLKAAK